jgi:hypothetical protein
MVKVNDNVSVDEFTEFSFYAALIPLGIRYLDFPVRDARPISIAESSWKGHPDTFPSRIPSARAPGKWEDKCDSCQMPGRESMVA